MIDSERCRMKENRKTACGKRHFEALEVDFDVVTKLSEVAIWPLSADTGFHRLMPQTLLPVFVRTRKPDPV